jgi:hypothetical protein
MTTTTVVMPASAKDHTMPPTHPTTTAGTGRRRHRHITGRAPATITAIALTMGLAGLALTAGSALADDCPNTALRAQNNSSELPDCRAYEMVTSAYKEGFPPVPRDDGYTDLDALGYVSQGNFAGNGMGAAQGNQYVARRSATGWQTTSQNPSGPEWQPDIGAQEGGADAMSADLRSSLWRMRPAGESSDLQYYYLRNPDGTFTRIGPSINPATAPGTPGPPPSTVTATVRGASDDLSHVVFILGPSAIFPGDTTTGDSLYEYVGTGNDRPQLVGVDNTGTLISTNGTCANGISNDGRVVFFLPGCSGDVWARINATTSIHMSGSECLRAASDPGGLCTGSDDAAFAGAAADGSRAFFTTTQQLVNGDTDQTSDLYACDIPPGTPTPVGVANHCASLIEVSGSATGANVETPVVRVSTDGSRVYFVAQGVLATNPGANDRTAVAGDHNLYVWQKNPGQPTGTTTFIARLDGNPFTNETGATKDGRYFVFLTSASLIDSGPGADTDNVADLYRYDALTGAIVRLSRSTLGDGGNDPNSPVVISGILGAITADGKTVVFETPERLSPLDTNSMTDVYEWHDGRVVPITASAGGGIQGVISASGKDIFFTSSEHVTAADGDNNPDVYDARIAGGFDLTTPTPCTDDACQGQHSTPPVLAAPTDARPDSNPGDVVPVLSVRKVTAQQRQRLAATGKLTLSVTVNTSATVTATATTTITGRSTRIATARQNITTPTTTTLTLTLTKQARATLATKGHLTLKLTIKSTKTALPHTATLHLTHTTKNPAAQRSSVRRVVGNDQEGRS